MAKGLNHVGLIIDGNRRFSKRLMLKPFKGHEWGAKKIRELLTWCKEENIKEVTLYTFSLENFDRPKKEFNYLMNLFEREFKKTKNDKQVYEDGVKFRFIGKIELFPENVKKEMRELEELTKNHENLLVNFAMAYSGRAEIVDAAKKIVEKVSKGELDANDINDETFAEQLYMRDEPDLIIRTSESRLSGFLLWQGSYSEIIFLQDVLWPEFSKKHFIQCINEYKRRHRRFGR